MGVTMENGSGPVKPTRRAFALDLGAGARDLRAGAGVIAARRL